jgi:hypothetical protein
VRTLDTRLLSALDKRKRKGVQIICRGCPHQHLAIGNAANGTNVKPNYEASACLRALCEGNRLRLTESKRSGEGVLWDYYSSIALGGFRCTWSLQEQVALAMQMPP